MQEKLWESLYVANGESTEWSETQLSHWKAFSRTDWQQTNEWTVSDNFETCISLLWLEQAGFLKRSSSEGAPSDCSDEARSSHSMVEENEKEEAILDRWILITLTN